MSFASRRTNGAISHAVFVHVEPLIPPNRLTAMLAGASFRQVNKFRWHEAIDRVGLREHRKGARDHGNEANHHHDEQNFPHINLHLSSHYLYI